MRCRARGCCWCCPDLGKQDRNSRGAVQPVRFTISEADVATMIADGLEVTEIAVRRNVAASTVRAQMKSIFRKMDINRQVELARILARLKV
jgi:DNA-binding CsgD family transcriptional regulator